MLICLAQIGQPLIIRRISDGERLLSEMLEMFNQPLSWWAARYFIYGINNGNAKFSDRKFADVLRNLRIKKCGSNFANFPSENQKFAGAVFEKQRTSCQK